MAQTQDVVTRFGPACVEAAIERLGISGRVWSAWDYDHWLLYRFHPAITVGWTWEYVRGQTGYLEGRAEMQSGPTGPQRYLDRHKVNTAILPTIIHMTGVGVSRLETHGWAMVYQDDTFFVLVRRTPATETLIQREEYRWIRVGKDALDLVTEANASEVLAEAERALRHCPGEGATFAWAYKTRALRLLGRHQEADTAARYIPQTLMIPL